MSDKLNFSLPKAKTKQPLIFIIILIGLILSLSANVLVVILNIAAPANSGILPVKAQKELAMKLQKESLYTAAIQAWKDYLTVARDNAQDRAAIWYTIGKIYQEAGMYEQALESYYRSESIAKRDDIKEDISRRVQDSLELLGKFAALRYELTDRVGLNNQQTGDDIIAEIGTEKITRADFNKRTEELVNLVVAQEGVLSDPETVKQRKEQLFKQFSDEDAQKQKERLKDYLNAEVLYRKAREEKLTEDPTTQALLKENERQILAMQLLSSKKSAMLSITENDLKTYYEAEKGDYIKDGKQQSFDEVKNEIYTKLFTQKQQEVLSQVIEELWKQYNVVIHTSKFEKDQTKPK